MKNTKRALSLVALLFVFLTAALASSKQGKAAVALSNASAITQS
jgi:hypothetical protein